jgi:hypothetical protein
MAPGTEAASGGDPRENSFNFNTLADVFESARNK